MINRRLVQTFVFLMSLVAWQSAVHATLLGDNVHLQAKLTHHFLIGSVDTAVVDPGVEFDVVNIIPWFIDVAGSSFVLGFDLTGFNNIGDTIDWTLAGLDWGGPPSEITGVTHTGGTGSAPVSINFDAHNIVVRTPNESVPPALVTYEFSIQAQPTIPEPASLALAGIGLAGLLLCRRRSSSV